jgi:NAD+ synthase
MTNQYDISRVTEWIDNYFRNAGRTNAIIGLSGGIDSAVTASLCVKALGKDRILGVVLPIHSSPQDEIDAKTLIKKLEIDHLVVEMDEVFKSWYTNLMDAEYTGHFIKTGAFKESGQMVQANAKARMRMTALYAISEMADGLVVGTTNKTEAMIGYATKYGDGGVDIEPIMGFYKTEIFEMAKLLDIPQEIIDKPPSAGLWPGQTDEEEIGLPYSEIDRILKYVGNRTDRPLLAGSTEMNIEKIQLMILRNAHKGKLPPFYERGL